MPRPLLGLSRTAALLCVALTATAQDDPARFPAANSRAELQARRAWYLWTAAAEPEKTIAELQSALQAAADDPARSAALNFYTAITLERRGLPAAWKKQLRQLAALGVEPYASWAAAQLEAPIFPPTQQDPEPREIPSYLQSWAANLDADEHEKPTQDARQELQRLGVLAVPAILAELPGYGVLGLRHAMPLLLPHADERVLRALEQRMLGGDESALYVIATAVETLPEAPRHRLGAIALHSPSLPAAIHGAACCADAIEHRVQVMEVLGQALHSSSTAVRDVALAVLATPVLGDEERALAWTREILSSGSAQQRETLVEFWLESREMRSMEEGIRFHSLLGAGERERYWHLRLSNGRGLLDPWELELALIDGANLSAANSLARTQPRSGIVIEPTWLREETHRLSALLLRERPLPETSAHWIFEQARSLGSLELSEAAALRYLDHPNPNIAFYAAGALIQVAPRTAMKDLPIGDLQQDHSARERLNACIRAFTATATAEDVPGLVDYLRRLDTATARYRSSPIDSQLQELCQILVFVSEPRHLAEILPLCRLDGGGTSSLRGNLGYKHLPPTPETAEQARLVLDVLHALPATMADRLTAKLSDAVDETCVDALARAIRRASQAGGGARGVSSDSPGANDQPLPTDVVQRRLLLALGHCGGPGREQLRGFLLDPDLGATALDILSADPAADHVALARMVFGPPGNRALFGAFLTAPLGVHHDRARFRALLDDSVRPLVRDLLASLIEHGEIHARPFLDALPREERIATCSAMLKAAASRSVLDGSRARLVRDAMESLGALQDPAIAETLAIAFRCADSGLRKLAIEQLAATLSPRVAPVLLRALDDPRNDVRAAAVAALTTLQDHLQEKQHWQEWIEKHTPRTDRKND